MNSLIRTINFSSIDFELLQTCLDEYIKFKKEIQHEGELKNLIKGTPFEKFANHPKFMEVEQMHQEKIKDIQKDVEQCIMIKAKLVQLKNILIQHEAIKI